MNQGKLSSVRTKAWVLSAVLMCAALVWLAVTATVDDHRRLFFGRWQIRHVGLCFVLVYLALLCFEYGKSKRALFRVVLGSIMALTMLASIELMGLMGLISFRAAFFPSGAVLGREAVPNLDVKGEAFQDLAYRWRYTTEPIPFHFVTDRRGFRNAVDRENADIYLLGDSILVASLIPFEQTLTARLARATDLRTMNIALIGLGP